MAQALSPAFSRPDGVWHTVLDAGADLFAQIGTTVEEAEKGLILRTLEHTKNNKTRAAEILGISLKTLHNKLKEYGSGASGKEIGAGV